MTLGSFLGFAHKTIYELCPRQRQLIWVILYWRRFMMLNKQENYYHPMTTTTAQAHPYIALAKLEQGNTNYGVCKAGYPQVQDIPNIMLRTAMKHNLSSIIT
jgi:hypothetical protein